MALNPHGLYGVFMDDTTNVFISGIRAMTINTGHEIESDPVSDSVYSQFQGLIRGNPGMLFTTLAINTALDKITASGMSIAALAGDGGTPDNKLQFFAQKHTNEGGRASGSNQRRYSCRAGMIIPQTLVAEGQGDAAITCRAVVAHDGNATYQPVYIVDGVALPTISGATGETSHNDRFALGPVTLESYALNSLQSVQIDFGIELDVLREGSEIYPTHVGISTIRPVITFRGVDPQWLDDHAATSSSVPWAGKQATYANTTIYLRKRAVAGFVPDTGVGNDVHIQIKAVGTLVIDQAADWSGQGLSETVVRLVCQHDGTNNPLVIADTTANIT